MLYCSVIQQNERELMMTEKMEKHWKAKWICDKRFAGLPPIALLHKEHLKTDENEHRADLKNRHMLVRKKFMAKMGEPAFLDITADDYYKLYINGKFVGQGPAPAYHFAYYYNRFRVDSYLQEGENVIAVHVYYQGEINRVWNSGDYRQGMICELRIGDTLVAASDESWKYSDAEEFVGEKTTGYATYYLEDIDCRLRKQGWKMLDFDDRDWSFVCVKKKYDYRFFPQPTPPVQVYRLSPHCVEETDSGRYLIDFGKEITGSLTFFAEGRCGGEQLRLLYGEELENGRVRYEMRCGCRYEERMILAKGGNEAENYDYKAFRYAEVEDPEHCIHPESFAAWVRHYPIEQEAELKTDNPVLDAVWKICANGVRCGAQEGYLDCPTREKGQYLGDLTITANAQIYLSGDLRMYKKALIDFSHSAKICPGLMAVVPGSFMQEIADFSLLWPHQLLTYYQHSGDRELLEELYPCAQELLAYFEKFSRKDGLLANVTDKWNLVDWPQEARDGYAFNLEPEQEYGCHNVLNAFYYGALCNLQEIREVLGKKSDWERCEKLKESFLRAFYDWETGRFTDTESSFHSALHSNVLPLYFDLTPNPEKTIEIIRKKGMRCSVYFSYFLLKALASHGQQDYAYELMTSTGENSWYNMVQEGATSCFEAWSKEKKWNTSLCHPWASSPVVIFVEDICGIRRKSPGGSYCLRETHIPQSLSRIFLKLPENGKMTEFRFENGEATLRTLE